VKFHLTLGHSVFAPGFQMKNHKLKGHDGPIVCMDAWEDMPTLRSDASTAEGVKSMTEATKYCKMRVISGGIDGRVCIWDGRKGKMLLSYPAHSGGTGKGVGVVVGYLVAMVVTDAAVQCAKVSWDGNRAATGGRDGIVCDWDLVKCVETHKFAGHSDAVVTLHVGQRFIASGSTDGLIKVWRRSLWPCLSCTSAFCHFVTTRSGTCELEVLQ
jgi:WD40 repeat protein